MQQAAADSVKDELLTTVYYHDNHFQVLDCSGKTGNRLNVRVIHLSNQKTYVEMNHILVLDLAQLCRVAAVLPCGTDKRSAIEIILDDRSPIILQCCTPAIFAEAMVQLQSHYGRCQQTTDTRTEISSVIDCYSSTHGPVSETHKGLEPDSHDGCTRDGASLQRSRSVKPSFWRRLRK